MSTTTDAEIADRFTRIVAASLAIDPATITGQAYLSELGAESLDLLEIAMEVETTFNIIVPEKNILQTAREVFGEGVLERGGMLTEVGKRLVRARMPEFAVTNAGGEMSVAEIERMFLRVDVWVRMIRDLAMETPRACARCESALEPSAPERMRCPKCRVEYGIRLGDEINRQWVRQYYEREYLPSQASSSPS